MSLPLETTVHAHVLCTVYCVVCMHMYCVHVTPSSPAVISKRCQTLVSCEDMIDHHSYTHNLRWPNTVFTRAFADVIQRVHKGCKNKRHKESDHFIYSKPTLSALFFSIIERSVLMALFCYYKDMLGKVATQRTQKFLAFLCYRKNPVKCSACAVAQKIETDCFHRNLPISNDLGVRISRNLAKQ